MTSLEQYRVSFNQITFNEEDFLGRGSYADVFRGRLDVGCNVRGTDSMGELVAIKRYFASSLAGGKVRVC